MTQFGISRRAAFSLPALLASSAAGASMPVADPDRELVALCGRFMSLQRRLDLLVAHQETADSAGDEALCNRIWKAQVRVVPYYSQLLAEIMALPSHTRPGLLAKAGVACQRIQYRADLAPWSDDAPLWSLCRDLLGDAHMQQIRR
jgi:hypothetical protein